MCRLCAEAQATHHRLGPSTGPPAQMNLDAGALRILWGFVWCREGDFFIVETLPGQGRLAVAYRPAQSGARGGLKPLPPTPSPRHKGT